MVELIPKTLEETAPLSEKLVFQALSEIKTRPDWIVLHSLKQRKVVSGLQAETDFVVFVPGKGIVLIEAKGATSVVFNEGKWTMEGVPEKAKHKDPYDQIDRGAANIRKQISVMEIDQNQIPMARLVWFPKMDQFSFHNDSNSGMAFSIYEMAFANQLKLAVQTIEDLLDQTIKSRKNNKEIVLGPSLLTADAAKAIARHLIGAMTAGQSIDQKAKIRNLAIEKAAIEHELMLDLIDYNQNIFFEGPAGAGKSNVLRSAAKKLDKQNKSVLFLTYNLLLEEDTRRALKDSGNVDVYAINDLLLLITSRAANPKGATEVWYDVELPKQALSVLQDDSKPLLKYDAIIVDEFQDFALRPLWLQVIRKILEDSKKRKPALLLAGDDGQRVHQKKTSDNSFQVAQYYFDQLFHVTLKTNVRQAPGLVAAIYKFLNRPNPFRRNLLSEDNVGSLEVYKINKGSTDDKTKDSELKKLAEIVKGLLEDYHPTSIRVLSPYGEQKAALVRAFAMADTHSSAVKELKKITKHTSNPEGKIRWRSIMKYKGLDADVVIVTDINTTSKNFAEERLGITLDDLLYIGMTRAKFKVILLVQDDLYPAGKLGA